MLMPNPCSGGFKNKVTLKIILFLSQITNMFVKASACKVLVKTERAINGTVNVRVPLIGRHMTLIIQGRR